MHWMVARLLQLEIVFCGGRLRFRALGVGFRNLELTGCKVIRFEGLELKVFSVSAVQCVRVYAWLGDVNLRRDEQPNLRISIPRTRHVSRERGYVVHVAHASYHPCRSYCSCRPRRMASCERTARHQGIRCASSSALVIDVTARRPWRF